MIKYSEAKFDKVKAGPRVEEKKAVAVEELKVTTMEYKPLPVVSPGKAPHLSNLVSGAEFKDEFVKELNKYHDEPNKDKKYNEVREACEFLFKVIVENCPQCTDRTTALQTVRLARMWANSAIALDGVNVGA